jgi:Flp pilus assembly pilin Flp
MGDAPYVPFEHLFRDDYVPYRTLISRLNDERGAAMVEFALLLPALLAIVLGIIQFGTAFNYWNDLNQMAADGARFAAVDKNPGGGLNSTNCAGRTLGSPPTLTDYIACQAEAADLRKNVNVCFRVYDATSGAAKAASAAQVGDAIKIRTAAPYTLDFGPLLSVGAITLRGNATMRAENVPTSGGLSGLGTECAT